MNDRTFRIFLSAASGEFATARLAVASDLRARGLEVKVQDDFRQEHDADTTLRLLHNYVRDCAAVVCLVGRRSGSFPPASAAEPFRAMLPPGTAAASYTQWELIFARRYGRRLSVYVANPDFPPHHPEPGPDDGTAGQTHFIDSLFDHGLGLHRSYFSTTDQLCRLVLKEDWPDHTRPKPILLPYPSLGTLFKGRDDVLDPAPRRACSRRRPTGGPRPSSARPCTAWAASARRAWRWSTPGGTPTTTPPCCSSPADTPQDLRRNLAGLVGPLVLDLPEQQDVTEEEARVAAALRWLQRTTPAGS